MTGSRANPVVNCPHCGQAMPAEPRRDPALSPLAYPNIVTIHDLPKGVTPKIEISAQKGNINGLPCAVRQIVLAEKVGAEIAA